MKTISIFNLLFFISLSLVAQKKMTGKVFDEDTKAQLAFASVYLISSKVGTVTNEAGEFSLEMRYSNDTLVIRYLGYYEIIKVVNNEIENMQLGLSPKINNIEGVRIVGNNDRLIEYILKASKNQRLNRNQSSVISKSYASINTYNDSVGIIESYEAFYSSKLNSIKIDNNELKNGIVRKHKNSVRNFYSIGIFETEIPRLNLFYGQMEYANDNLVRISQNGMTRQKSTLIESSIISPTQLHSSKEISKIFTISVVLETNNMIKLKYFKKTDNYNYGFITINKKAEQLKEINVSQKNHKKTISSIVDQSVVRNQYTNTKIIYNEKLQYNIPLYVSLELLFDYITNKTQISKVRINASQFFYRPEYQFTDCYPYLNSLTNYEQISLKPIQDSLWLKEIPFVKTKSDLAMYSNLETTNFSSVFYTDYKIIDDRWNLDWNEMNKTILFGKRKYNISTFVLCDVYYSENGYSIKTKPVFDYKNSFYALPPIPTLPKKSLEDSLVYDIIIATTLASNKLKYKLESIDKLNNRIVKKEFKKTEKELKLSKEMIYKKWWQKYKVEYQNFMIE